MRAVRGRRGWTRTMGEARFRSRGSCGVFAPAEVLSPVERAEERLDVPRVPGFEPVPDSAKSPRNPAFVGKTEGLCGSERVRKRLTERETAGSTAGSGQPSGTSTAESFLRRVGRRSVGNRPRSGEIETRASTKVPVRVAGCFLRHPADCLFGGPALRAAAWCTANVVVLVRRVSVAELRALSPSTW